MLTCGKLLLVNSRRTTVFFAEEDQWGFQSTNVKKGMVQKLAVNETDIWQESCGCTSYDNICECSAEIY